MLIKITTLLLQKYYLILRNYFRSIIKINNFLHRYKKLSIDDIFYIYKSDFKNFIAVEYFFQFFFKKISINFLHFFEFKYRNIFK